jgi:predicted transporter
MAWPSRDIRRRLNPQGLRIGLGCGASLLRSRRFHEQVIIGAIGLAALAALSRENQARTFTRLAAWDKQRAAKARPA